MSEVMIQYASWWCNSLGHFGPKKKKMNEKKRPEYHPTFYKSERERLDDKLIFSYPTKV